MFCFDSLCLSWIPVLLSHILESLQQKKAIPTHSGGGEPREDPIFNFYGMAAVQEILLFALCLSQLDIPFSLKQSMRRKWKGNCYDSTVGSVNGSLASGCFSCSDCCLIAVLIHFRGFHTQQTRSIISKCMCSHRLDAGGCYFSTTCLVIPTMQIHNCIDLKAWLP